MFFIVFNIHFNLNSDSINLVTMNINQPVAANLSSTAPDMDSIKATPLKSSGVNKWLQALELFDANKRQQALELFTQITPTNSKIIYNIASIYSILGRYSKAITYFKKATSFDSYMAISHFQIGVSRFLAGSYAKAATSFNTALKLLRGNTVVNYQQLGLDYKLYSCEIVYNRALAYIYSGELATGIFDLGFAAKEKKYIPEHNIIDEALVHFTEMEKSQNQLTDKTRENIPPLPGALDIRKQRFSVVNPPKNLQIFNASQSSSAPSAEMFEKTCPTAPWKQMAYSLFSVPQGSLFRLTEIKVRSILNDKSLEEMMSLSNPKTTLASTASGTEQKTKRISFDRLNFRSSPQSSKSKSSNEANSTQYPTNNSSTTTGVLTPPVSPDLSASENETKGKQEIIHAKTTTSSLDKHLESNEFTNLAQNTQNLHITPNSQSQKSGKPFPNNSSTPPTSSPSGSVAQSTSLANALNGTNDLSVKMSKSHSNNSSQSTNSSHNSSESQKSSHRHHHNHHHHHHPRHNHIRTSGDAGHVYDKETTSLNNIQSPSTHSGFSDSRSVNVYPNYSSPASFKPHSLKIKLFCGNETRAIKVEPGISFPELRSRIASKVQGKNVAEDSPILTAISNNLILRIKDEDDDLVLIGDQEDLDVAISEAFVQSKGTPKLIVYVENTFEAEI